MIQIFAGAGASKAVNPEKYPTTVEFFEKLPIEIRENSVFNVIINFVQSVKEKEIVDIEDVLWELSELNKSLKSSINSDNIFGYIMEKNRLASSLKQPQKIYNDLKNLSVGAIKNLENLIFEIYKLVYNFYGSLPERKELTSTWNNLFNSLLRMDTNIEVFTTNYDMVIEESLQIIKNKGVNIIDGRQNTIQPTLNVTHWQNPQSHFNKDSTNIKNIVLTKLHGSVDWIRRNDNQIGTGLPEFIGEHERHVIVYPGFKGNSFNEPFLSFHNYFSNCVGIKSKIVFIGFAFRDEYINNIITLNGHPNSEIYVINPGDLSKSIPYESGQINKINKGFNKSSILELIKKMNY